jgi:gliding motility-associated-like protein
LWNLFADIFVEKAAPFMRKFYFSLLFVLLQLSIAGFSLAQVSSLAPTLIGSSGNFSSAGFGSISSSVGEPIITTVTTGTLTLTQGFQQPEQLACPTFSNSFTVDPPGAVCEGTNVTITPLLSGGNPPFTYLWSSGQTTTAASINVAPTVTTAYSFTISGCPTVTGTHTVIIDAAPSAAIAGPDQTLCSGALILGATNSTSGTGSWLWVSGPATATPIITNTSSPTTTVTGGLIPGIYGFEWTVSNGVCAVNTSTVTILINPAMSLSPTGAGTSCASSCDGSVNSGPAGGTSPYTFSWNDPSNQTTQTATGLCAQNYTLVLSDMNGCSTSSVVAVTSGPVFTATVTASDSTLCKGDNAVLTASGGSSYFWAAGGESTASINIAPTASTDYTVTVSNGACSLTNTLSITVASSPTVNVSGTTTVCSGQQATLGASGGATYSWSPGGTGAVINPVVSSPTNFTVTATNAAGCSDTTSIFVSVTPTPVAGIGASPPSICAGGTSTLSASGGNTYQWNTGSSATSIQVSPVIPTSYTVTAFNGSCFDTSVFNLNVTNFNTIISITNNDSILCVGDNSILTASLGNSYSWSTGESTQSIPISPANTTTYVVTVTSVGGCTGTDSMLVDVLPIPTAAITALKDTVCVLQGAGLTASGGSTYQWDGGPAVANYNPIILTQGPHSYSVTVSNGSCNGGATYTVFANPIPAVTANASPNTICPGDTVALSATANNGSFPYTFGWFPGSIFGQNINVSPSSSITYTIAVVDGKGCSNFSTAPVTMNTISVNAGANMTICPGFTAPLNAIVSGNISGVQYSWAPDSLVNNPTAQNPSGSPVDSISMFIVTVTNGSCSAKDSITVYSVRIPECIIKIYNGVTPNGDADNNIWFIDGIESYPDNKVIIFNRWGGRVWGAEGYNNKEVVWNGSNDQGESLPDGTYYYVVELYDGTGGTIFSRSNWVEVTH